MKRIRGKKLPLTAAGVHALRDEYTRTIEPARALAAETLNLERVSNAECGMRSADCRQGLRPNPGRDCSDVANRPAPHAHSATRNLISLLNPKGAASQPHTEGRTSCLLY